MMIISSLRLCAFTVSEFFQAKYLQAFRTAQTPKVAPNKKSDPLLGSLLGTDLTFPVFNRFVPETEVQSFDFAPFLGTS